MKVIELLAVAIGCKKKLLTLIVAQGVITGRSAQRLVRLDRCPAHLVSRLRSPTAKPLLKIAGSFGKKKYLVSSQKKSYGVHQIKVIWKPAALIASGRYINNKLTINDS